MKISQDEIEFKPITIVLETEEEANALWEVVENGLHGDYNVRNICRNISNAFCEELTIP